MSVPFFRPSITEAEIAEVVATLRSGWLTTGPRTRQFEQDFARTVGARHAVAVNSCTAALHLALEAVGLRRGELVLVPTMTFGATAEVVRYFDAIPVLVDCEPDTLCIDVGRARATLEELAAGRATAGLAPPYGKVRAIIPMHYGGQVADVAAVRQLATEYDLSVIDDAAHTLPAYYRDPAAPDGWQMVGRSADIACFSFYANKCITTGEGGMAVTDSDQHAARMRVMSLHGMSKDAWKRFTAEGSWYYELVAPGFKYNLTDIASAIGLVQLGRAEALWQERRALAAAYHAALGELPGLTLPVERPDRRHSWHLYAIRIDPAVWGERAGFIQALKEHGIGASVHWMPLHLHPYYRDTYGYQPGLFPVAEAAWPGLVSLPLFPGMTRAELAEVVAAFRAILTKPVAQTP
ncbi:MAG: DegT/DnrJ/EryC1/StrS aminotransferase family protein [Deltaproteobacteria bacterium]|nr:DegT/DnrJ/EryC1/StrS aminotransferase family protein [Deltaproteobacteria bacterium]